MTDRPESPPVATRERRRPRSRSFAPVVLIGLAAALLLAVGGTKPWVRPRSPAAGLALSPGVSPSLGGGAGEVPLAGALGLVLLAAWGVLLVSRGRVRRALAVLAVLAAGGEVVVAVLGRHQAASTLATELGVTRVATSATGWYWVAAVAAPVALLTAMTAVRLVPSWPAMSSRYDAPSAGPAPARALTRSADRPVGPSISRSTDRSADPTTDHPVARPPDEALDPVADAGRDPTPDRAVHDANLDLWRALDRGHDPTA